MAGMLEPFGVPGAAGVGVRMRAPERCDEGLRRESPMTLDQLNRFSQAEFTTALAQADLLLLNRATIDQAAKVFEDGRTGLTWREAKGRRAVNMAELTSTRP